MHLSERCRNKCANSLLEKTRFCINNIYTFLLLRKRDANGHGGKWSPPPIEDCNTGIFVSGLLAFSFMGKTGDKREKTPYETAIFDTVSVKHIWIEPFLSYCQFTQKPNSTSKTSTTLFIKPNYTKKTKNIGSMNYSSKYVY